MHRYRVDYAIELKRKDFDGTTSFISSRSCFFFFICILLFPLPPFLSLSLSLSLFVCLSRALAARNRSTSDRRNVQFHSIDVRASSLCKRIRADSKEKEKLKEDKPCRNVYIFSQIGDTSWYTRSYVTRLVYVCVCVCVRVCRWSLPVDLAVQSWPLRFEAMLLFAICIPNGIPRNSTCTLVRHDCDTGCELR